MKRIWLALLLVVVLGGCQRSGGEQEPLGTLVPVESTPGEYPQAGGPETMPVLTPIVGAEPVITPTIGLVEPPPPAPAPPVDTGRLSALRFALNGSSPNQANFPVGTDQVCAIWDFRDLTPNDTIRRVWYLNDQLYVERQETWDVAKYGATGTRTDVCLYDRIDGYIDGAVDGVDPGNWRVEVFLNGERLLTAGFTIGGP